MQAVHVPLKAPLKHRVFDWETWDAGALLPQLQETAASDGILELNLHLLMRGSGVHFKPPWLGEPLRFENLDQRAVSRPNSSLILPWDKGWKRKRWFLPAESAKWDFISADVQEVNSQGGQTVLSQAEFATSREGSSNIISLLPVRKINGRIWVGLAQSNSPALQMRRETSLFWTVPVWRVFNAETSLEMAVQDSRRMFEHRFDLEVKSVQPLGASFRPDPEVSSDLIYPFVAEVDPGDRGDKTLDWYPLDSLIGRITSLRDSRLILSLFRLDQAPKR